MREQSDSKTVVFSRSLLRELIALCKAKSTPNRYIRKHNIEYWHHIEQAEWQISHLIAECIPDKKKDVEMWQIEKEHPSIAYTLPDIYEAAFNSAIDQITEKLRKRGINI